MTEPLYKAAEKGILSDYQIMDVETIGWITRSIPKNLIGIDLSEIKKIALLLEIEKLADFSPDTDWYQNKKAYYGIHGFLHNLRVAINSLILNEVLNLQLNKSNLILAGLCHDIRRLNDKDDPNHGYRASEWIKNNQRLINNKFNGKLLNIEYSFIQTAVAFHDISFDDSCRIETLPKEAEYLDVLKAADALDRYRLPKLKWWFSDTCVKLSIPLEIKSFAFNLILTTEMDRMRNLPIRQSIQCFLRT